MPRLARTINKSGFFHIMVQGLDKSYIFKKEKQKQKYYALIKKYYKQYDIKIIAYCIMNNHAHILVNTSDILRVSQFMKIINTTYSRYYNKTNNRVGYVYRDRFKSQYINNDRYLLYCIKYIHMNPVKAGIVQYEGQYKYSSYNNFINKNEFIDDDVIKIVFNDLNYIDIFKNIEDKDIEVLDVDREDENFKIAVKDYLEENNITLEEIKNNKVELLLFCECLRNKRYKLNQIAKLLNVSIKKISEKMSMLK